jgi:hypothetical protein
MQKLIYILPLSINALELITIIIGFVYYKKYSNTKLKYFLWFLVYGFLTEMLGIAMGVGFKEPNYIIFNIYSIVYFLFFYWLFYTYLKKTINKRFVKGFIIFFILTSTINSVFFQSIHGHYQSYTWFFGSTTLIITIILFFTEMLNSEAIFRLKHLLLFWVGAGALLFQLGFIPVFIATKYINYSNGLTYGYILLILNLITSVCYSLGFIWTKKNLNY